MSNNASQRTAPAALSAATAGDTNPHSLVLVYFRRSADGVTFDITPVYLHPADATRACNAFPHEYSRDGSTWAAWPGGYNNASVAIGGRGRLLGATVAAG